MPSRPARRPSSPPLPPRVEGLQGMSRMTQKRRCWTAVAVFALLASGARVPTLLGPALSRSRDPFAGAAAPALHASFGAATEVTARGDGDDPRADASDDRADGNG